MAIQSVLNTQTNYIEFPDSDTVVPGGTKIVETYGTIAELTDTALAAKFPNEDDAQAGDLIWVGTGRNVISYRMAQDATNAKLAASWEESKAGGSSIVTVTAVGSLLEVDAFPSAGINGVIQPPLTLRPEITGLTATSQWTPEDAPYLVKDAADIWHIGRFRLEFPNFGLEGTLFKPSGYEIKSRTLVWDDNENQMWILEPVSSGGQAYKLGSGDSGGSTVVETLGAIAELTDEALAAKFPNGDEAQSGDLIYVAGVPYRMQQGATDARLAASWGRDTVQADNALPLDTTSTNPVQATAIATALKAIIGGAPEEVDTLKELNDKIDAEHTQPELIIFNPAAPTRLLEYSHIYFVDLRGTAADNRLILQLPGTESNSLRMDIIIRDIPIDTFKEGYLSIQAMPDGATPIQILTPQGLTDDAIANVSAFDLQGSEIYLARTAGSVQWMMNIRLEGSKKSDIWYGETAPDPAVYKIWTSTTASPGEMHFWSPADGIWERS